MRPQPSTFDRIGQALRLPFNLFADDSDHMLDRLEAMHRSMPGTLPQKRFFKH